MSTKPKYWHGGTPVNCDIPDILGNQHPMGDVMIDGATRDGPWACMCAKCHKRIGRGLGQGRGQRYKKQPSGLWLKTGG